MFVLTRHINDPSSLLGGVTSIIMIPPLNATASMALLLELYKDPLSKSMKMVEQHESICNKMGDVLSCRKFICKDQNDTCSLFDPYATAYLELARMRAPYL